MHQRGERALAAAPGEGERGEVSFASHVPGIRATGRSQVAAKTIPWPGLQRVKKSISERNWPRTFIERLHRTPAPRHKSSDVADIGH
jgi:hypothetical protein